jgi:hypothetical protein
MSTGVLYVAYGEPARVQCARSIATLHQHAPQLAVAVVSETPLGSAQHIYQPEADLGARTHKTRMYSLSPFDMTLYLDADTEVLHSPEAGFNLLQWVEVVLSQDCNRRFADCHWQGHNAEERAATLAEIGCAGDLLYYNSGVIFFKRSPRAETFFEAWHTEWRRWKMHDQMALVRALYRHPLRIATLREQWNTHHKQAAVFVFHNHRTASRPGAPR